jgi:hypothetical protein
MWEVISAITGVVSAICAVVSVVGIRSSVEESLQGTQSHAGVSTRSIFSFLLVSSGWTLCVLSFIWIVQPYGRYMRHEDYVQIIGIIFGLPAFLLTSRFEANLRIPAPPTVNLV